MHLNRYKYCKKPIHFNSLVRNFIIDFRKKYFHSLFTCSAMQVKDLKNDLRRPKKKELFPSSLGFHNKKKLSKNELVTLPLPQIPRYCFLEAVTLEPQSNFLCYLFHRLFFV